MTPDSLIECGFSLFMLFVYAFGHRSDPAPDESKEICYREFEERP